MRVSAVTHDKTPALLFLGGGKEMGRVRVLPRGKFSSLSAPLLVSGSHFNFTRLIGTAIRSEAWGFCGVFSQEMKREEKRKKGQ